MPYKDKEKQREYSKAYSKAWYEANKEAQAEYHKARREANKEAQAEYHKAWREANKEAVAEKRAKRKALKRNAVPKFLRHCQEEKKRLQKIYRLRQLLSDATDIIHHVDHMWPLSDGGPHWSGNLQIITAQENLLKGAHVDEEIKATIKEGLKKAYEGGLTNA
jgi:5-methylcytosine-specific restriction endonuclease McrA